MYKYIHMYMYIFVYIQLHDAYDGRALHGAYCACVCVRETVFVLLYVCANIYIHSFKTFTTAELRKMRAGRLCACVCMCA